MTYIDFYLFIKRIRKIIHGIVFSYWGFSLLIGLIVIIYLFTEPTMEEMQSIAQVLDPYVIWFQNNISQPLINLLPEWMGPGRKWLIPIFALIIPIVIEFCVEIVGLAFGWIERKKETQEQN